MITDEQSWKDDGDRNGWVLPPPAHWFVRLPVVRTVRYLWVDWKIERHYAAYSAIGLTRTGYDEWVLYAIARGWC